MQELANQLLVLRRLLARGFLRKDHEFFLFLFGPPEPS